MPRITVFDTNFEAACKIGDQSNEAKEILSQTIDNYKFIDPDSSSTLACELIGIIIMIILDTYEIYGYEIVRLFNKCDNEQWKFIALLKATASGLFNVETLKVMAQNDVNIKISNDSWMSIIKDLSNVAPNFQWNLPDRYDEDVNLSNYDDWEEFLEDTEEQIYESQSGICDNDDCDNDDLPVN